MTVIATRDQSPQIVRSLPIGARPTSAATSTGMTGKDFVRILRKRAWMIIICLVSTVVLTALATQLWKMYAPLYTAEAYILVNPPKNASLEGQLPAQEVMDRLCQNAAQLIQRDPVMDDACKSKDLINTSWFAKDPSTAPRRLKIEIGVVPVPKTNLIRVTKTGLAPRELADIVNAVANAGVNEAINSRQTDRRDDLKKLDEELTNFTTRLTQVQREDQNLLSDATVTSLTTRGQSLQYQMGALMPDLTRLTALQAEADKSLRTIQKQADQEGVLENSPKVMEAVEADGTLRQLQMMESTISMQLDELKAKFGPKHPKIGSLQQQVESARQQMQIRRQQLIQLQVKAVLAKYEEDLNNVTSQVVELREQYQAAEAVARDVQARLTKHDQLQDTMHEIQDQIKRLGMQKTNMALLLNADPPISLRSMAQIPAERSHPKWSLMMPLGVVLGLVVGLGLAFLLELIDTSIKSPTDVSRRVDLPLLGMIPHLEDIDEEIEDLRLAFSTAPTSLIGEAFRQIRTCLLFSGPASTRRSLLVTSALPEDGRTTVSLNLAAAMAQGGRKVLVVDANFRQPSIHKLFPNSTPAGLSDALVGQAKWADLVHSVGPNLAVLASGPLPPNPSELVGSDSMRQLIAEMTAQYDQVIFDGAPSLVVSDSIVLSTLVDGVVLTVRAGANTYGIVQRTRDMLNRVGAHMLGVVLNGIRITAGGYLKKSYETYYEYHSQDRLPVEAEKRP